ncbi:Ribonuclease P protein subunit p21 [Linnemannia zychae]|nr:Ribonuclease P protein subunit p21 [Linnemannia zychae]
MAKKDKKGENTIQNKEIFQRMNFLYQAATCMATIISPPSEHLTNKSKNIQPHHATKSQPTTESIVQEITSRKSHNDITSTETVPTEATALSVGDIDMEIARQRPRKLSRKKTRKLLQDRKNRIAMEQISGDERHHRLTNSVKNTRVPLSNIARFYASTLMEVGRKNVIRIDPTIKRSVCQRCEALLIPSISSMPQLHTKVTCTACGAFRRYFCMPGKGIVGDRWELEEAIGDEDNNVEMVLDGAMNTSSAVSIESSDRKNNGNVEDPVIEETQKMEDPILQEDVV